MFHTMINRYTVYTTVKKELDGNTWDEELQIGTAFRNGQGIVTAYLDVLPVNGKLKISPHGSLRLTDDAIALIYLSDRLFRMATEFDKVEGTCEIDQVGPQALAAELLTAFGSYVSCVAEDHEWNEETVDGLKRNLQASIERLLPKLSK